MGGSPRPYLRFAGFSFFVMTLLALAAVFAGVRLAASAQERASAREAAAIVLPVVERAAEGSEGDERALRTAAAVLPLISDGVLGVRVRAADGEEIAAAGAPADVRIDAAAGDISHTRSVLGDGGGGFVTVAGGEGYVVEVTQDAAPVDAAIADARRERAVTALIFVATGWLLVQGAFWFGVRTFGAEHGRLTYLYQTGQQLRASIDLQDVLARIATDAAGLASARYALVALYDAGTSELVLKAAYDGADGSVTLLQRPVDEWYMRRCIVTGTAVTAELASAAYAQFFGHESSEDKGMLLCTPISLGERVVGAIALLREGTERAFTATEMRVVEELASQAVTAVEQAMLFAKVQADADQLAASYDSTLKALMAALDAKDELTEGHCERVAKLTVALAREMGLPEEMMVHVERGALLHDVGKIGVPDGILKKPRALTESEWEAMRKHPLLAGLMISKVGFLEPALPILLYHHERYDGSGYPFGLAGENIPMEARIFSSVDAYDAMTSSRPYRAAMTHHAAMDEIRAHAGLQFDPDVVAAFERMMAKRPELRVNAGHRPVLHTHDDDLEPRLGEPAA